MVFVRYNTRTKKRPQSRHKDQSERACASCTPYHGSPLRHTQMMQLGVFGPLLCKYLPSFSPLKQARPAAINLRRQKINPPIRTSPLLVTAAHKKIRGPFAATSGVSRSATRKSLLHLAHTQIIVALKRRIYKKKHQCAYTKRTSASTVGRQTSIFRFLSIEPGRAFFSS